MRLLTVKEVAEIIRAKESTVYSWAEQGLLPCYKINGLLRFDEYEIKGWIETCKKSVGSYNYPIGRRPRKGGQE